MKRKLLRLTILLGLLAGALIAAVILVLPGKARAWVASTAGQSLGVSASLEGAGVGLAGSVLDLSLEQFALHNPPEFEGPPLLQLDKVSCSLRPASLLSGVLDLDEVALEGLRLRLIQDGSRSNLAPLFARLREHASRPDGPTDEAPEPEGPSADTGPRLSLDQLRISGLGIDVILRGLGPLNTEYSATLPAFTLSLEELKAPDGGPPTLSDLVGFLLEAAHERALDEASKHLPEEAVRLLRGDSPEDILGAELLKRIPKPSADVLRKKLGNRLDKLLGDG